MDCPNCGTWNPPDKRKCWRCQYELPIPVEKKKREPIRFLGLPIWVFLIIGLFLLFPMLSQCGGLIPGQ